MTLARPLVLLITALSLISQLESARSQGKIETTDSKAAPKEPTPTVFQADEGDRWMLLGDKPLIFKGRSREHGVEQSGGLAQRRCRPDRAI